MRDDPSIERETGGRDAGNVAGQVNLAFAAIFADFAHSPASIFLPSAGWTRVTLKRPSAHTTVNPSASTAAISPSLPPMPFGSFAGIGLASKILSCLPSNVVQAPGAGLQPRMSRSICSHGLHQVDAFEHRLDAHREETVEINGAKRVGGGNRRLLLDEDIAGIEPVVGP